MGKPAERGTMPCQGLPKSSIHSRQLWNPGWAEGTDLVFSSWEPGMRCPHKFSASSLLCSPVCCVQGKRLRTLQLWVALYESSCDSDIPNSQTSLPSSSVSGEPTDDRKAAPAPGYRCPTWDFPLGCCLQLRNPQSSSPWSQAGLSLIPGNHPI